MLCTQNCFKSFSPFSRAYLDSGSVKNTLKAESFFENLTERASGFELRGSLESFPAKGDKEYQSLDEKREWVEEKLKLTMNFSRIKAARKLFSLAKKTLS